MMQSERVTISPISPCGSARSASSKIFTSQPVRAKPQLESLSSSAGWCSSCGRPVMVIGASPWP